MCQKGVHRNSHLRPIARPIPCLAFSWHSPQSSIPISNSQNLPKRSLFLTPAEDPYGNVTGGTIKVGSDIDSALGRLHCFGSCHVVGETHSLLSYIYSFFYPVSVQLLHEGLRFHSSSLLYHYSCLHHAILSIHTRSLAESKTQVIVKERRRSAVSWIVDKASGGDWHGWERCVSLLCMA